MKPFEQRMSEPRRQRVETIVARHVHQLFQRLPMLSGFWLQPELEAPELSVCTWRDHTDGRDLYEEVLQSLVDLADECPEAVQLMCGRTFARVVH
jgi:hypothetical protein